MDEWMSGWMSGWMEGWMEGWMDGRMDGRIEEGTNPTHAVGCFVYALKTQLPYATMKTG